MRMTERLAQILASVNATAIDNDDGKPGETLAAVCHEAADRLRYLDRRINGLLEKLHPHTNTTATSDPRQFDLEKFIQEMGAPRDFDGMPIVDDVGC